MSDNTLPSGHTRINSLEMRNITKRFPGVLANSNVDFDVRAGEVHALLGENGAGKSTLMKVLYGLYGPEEGEIYLNGKPITIESPTDAINQGIGMIHQHFMLVETLTVAENVALGLPSSRGFLTDLDRVSERILELGKIYGLDIDPNAYIWQLSVGQQQRVEIIKALYRGAALLILDEPTAVLTPQEVNEFFVIMRQMVADGHALIFISHKLHEIMDICDRVTVLRDGRKIGTKIIADITKSELANWMVGREVSMTRELEDIPLGPARLQLENVTCKSDRGTPALRGVSLDVHSGEILGVAGISGNGQRELAEAITGLRDVTGGTIHLEGQDVTNFRPGVLTERMLSYIPEERMKDGMIKDFSIAENMILREHHKNPFANKGFLMLKTIAKHSDVLIDRFRVKTPSRDTKAGNLSGGNIQKVVLAREISRQPRVLIAAQPSRGLDVGATEYVHAQLLEQRGNGTAIMMISEDLDEIMGLSDRIAVICEGELMGIVPRDEATPEKLGLMMAGVAPEEA
ncbi:MAG: ABC transporter ATP-binding protein [Anaerolineae bacterium]|mgnify:CR=1 FL=1|jgi:general nucleoside transport system ATP-binding protein|nr:ABC transporter ATP-binding protein [Anaerolineae bacterium]MBT7071935.1 ABC transporter ATP-binding protein [Anaerolineae bacterium]MBT7323949.1 ABC transporter ATP-binding protein [Anaerolineae bacterium]